jgi:hypothetical protein
MSGTSGNRDRGVLRSWLRPILLIGIPVVVVAVPLVIVGQYTPPTTSIKLDILTTEVSFDARPEQIDRLLGAVESPKLYLSKFTKIDLGPGHVRLSPSDSWDSPDAWIEAATEGATATISPASLARIDVPANAEAVRVLFSWEEAEPSALRVSLGPVESVRLSPTKVASITCTYCRGVKQFSDQVSLTFTSSEPLGHEMRLIPRDGSLSLGVNLSAPDQFRIHNLPVAGRLEFQHTGEARPISSSRGGILFVTDLGDRSSEISPGAMIQMLGLSQFQVNDIHFKADSNKALGLEVTASGTVNAMTVDGRNVLPVRMARAFAGDRSVLWEIAATLFAGAAGVAATLHSKRRDARGKSNRST